MYNASDLRKGLKVEIESEPYEITEYNFTKPGKGKAFYTCRLKHMVNGSTLTRNYRSADKIDQPQLTQRDLHYSYQEGSNFVFMDEDLDVQVLFHNGKAVEVTLPTFVVKTIVVTEPGARGNTATNVFKPAQVEGGYEIQVPLFINEGDLVRVDTRTGKYADRVNKK
jgi:elongation factor P